MSLGFAQILRFFSVGMLGYYLNAIGLAYITYQFWIVIVSVLALNFLGQAIGYITKDNENIALINKHFEAAKLLQKFTQDEKEKTKTLRG